MNEGFVGPLNQSQQGCLTYFKIYLTSLAEALGINQSRVSLSSFHTILME